MKRTEIMIRLGMIEVTPVRVNIPFINQMYSGNDLIGLLIKRKVQQCDRPVLFRVTGRELTFRRLILVFALDASKHSAALIFRSFTKRAVIL